MKYYSDRNEGKLAFFDCFSGISGDMCLGALVDAGVPLKEIARELKKINLRGFSLSEKRVTRFHLTATKVDVLLAGRAGKGKPKKWADIQALIRSSSLSEDIKARGEDIFRRLFAAEGAAHGLDFRKIHLHELGAVDCVVDILGTLIGLDLLGVKDIYSSPINLGSGTVKTSHGVLPVPAPATAELLTGVPVYRDGEPFEMTTPTGAAIIRTLATGFGEAPCFITERIGTGAGGRETEGRANVLRILIGTPFHAGTGGNVTLLETNIDDMNPQIYEHLSEKLFAAGALDVYLTNITMKKMRPAVKLTVICDHERKNSLIYLIMRETTSIGVRYFTVPRACMEREIKGIATKYGKVRVKISRWGDIVKTTPEYEDCKRLSQSTGTPILRIIEEAKRAAEKMTRSV